jgi:hypothetical protein
MGIRITSLLKFPILKRTGAGISISAPVFSNYLLHLEFTILEVTLAKIIIKGRIPKKMGAYLNVKV